MDRFFSPIANTHLPLKNLFKNMSIPLFSPQKNVYKKKKKGRLHVQINNHKKIINK